MTPLGYCIACRYAHDKNGGSNNPFEPALYLVGGCGLCAACALAMFGTILTQPQVTAAFNVKGRRPNRSV